MLCCLSSEVVPPVLIEELSPVMGRKIVPLACSHTENTFFGILQTIHKGLNREIVPDSIAFNRTARAADIDVFAVSVCSCHRETDLASTECGKIGLSREAQRCAVAVFITDMDERLPSGNWQGLEPHPVVIRAEGAFIGAEDDIQVSLLLFD